MSEPVVRQIVLASRPNGPPTAENFRLEQVPMPTLPPGGLLLRVLYLSLDPYMRGRMDDRKSYARSVGIGEAMTGESVCEVVASDRQSYAPGDIVLAHTGWRTHAAWDGPAPRKLDPKLAPITTGLGVLGMPGFHGLFRPLRPRQTQSWRDGCRFGGERAGWLAGRATAPKQSALAPSVLPAAPTNAVMSSTSCGSTPALIIARRICRRSLRRNAQKASTSISKMSAARCGKRCCRCSIPTRAFRSAG